MTKGELLEALCGLMDEIDLVVNVGGKEAHITHWKYIPSADENPAYVMLEVEST